tara:strand:+ start:3283 stop:3861 length:579 start_codon:yes stop_codon:yes gene_type:complete
MNEEMMTAGTGGFSGSANAKGPVAGFDPVMKFRKKMAKRKKIKEDNEIDRPIDMSGRSRLFQYKVNIPKVGETIVYANSPAQLTQKLRLLINPRYRGDIKIERILPANAAKFFMDKRMAHLKNVDTTAQANKRLYAKEELEQKFKNQQAQAKVAIEKKKVELKKRQLQTQLQMKTQSLRKQARAGTEQDETR